MGDVLVSDQFEPWVDMGDVELRPGMVYTPHFGARIVADYGEDAAWLLLSLDHYGWRAHFDIASAATRGVQSLSMDEHHTTHLQSTLDLHVQSALFSVTEQLARLVLSGLKHNNGIADFMDIYIKPGSLPSLLKQLADIQESQVRDLMGIPDTTEEVRDGLIAVGYDEPDLSAVAELGHHQLATIARDITTNLREVQDIASNDRVENQAGDLDRAKSLRTIDNAYRHGFRVLFPDTLPQPLTLRALVRPGSEPQLTDHGIMSFRRKQNQYSLPLTLVQSAQKPTSNHFVSFLSGCAS